MAMLVDGMNISSSLNSGLGAGRLPQRRRLPGVRLPGERRNAEFSSGGVTINMIPKEGGNTIKPDGVALFANGNFQTQNVSDEQRAQGVAAPAKTRQDVGLQLSWGFPIMQDRMWWFSSVAVLGLQQLRAERASTRRQPDRGRQRRARLDEPRHGAAQLEEQVHGDVRPSAEVSAATATSSSARWRRKRLSCSARPSRSTRRRNGRRRLTQQAARGGRVLGAILRLHAELPARR